MPSLYLHIGTHKTGTTAIQNFMLKHEDMLSDLGLAYPRIGLVDAGHHDVAWACGQGAHKLNPDLIMQVCDLVKSNEYPSHQRFLLSSEEFEYIQDISPLRPLADTFDTKIIIYLRKQDHYLESDYNQHVRMYSIRFAGSIYQFAQRYNFYQRYNYNRLVERWANVFGKENIILRPYGTELVNADACKDILSVLGASTSTSFPQVANNFENVSLATAALPYLAYLNQLPLTSEQHQKLIELLAIDFRSDKKSRLLLQQDANAFYEKFRPSNQLLFEQYSSWQGVPFDDLHAADQNSNWVNHEQVDVRRLLRHAEQVLFDDSNKPQNKLPA